MTASNIHDRKLAGNTCLNEFNFITVFNYLHVLVLLLYCHGNYCSYLYVYYSDATGYV